MKLKFDFREIAKFSQGIHEWIGRSVYWATGQMSELFTHL